MQKTKEIISKPELKLFGALLLLLTVFLFISLVAESKHKREETPVATSTDPFASVRLTAKAAYVYDLRDKAVLYAKNEDGRMALASLTKVMTALVATEMAPDADILITRAALSTEGDSGLIVGEKWKMRDLLDFALTSSSNDGMHAVALAFGEQAFVARMNLKADELGMKDTYFLNETGLDISSGQAGAYGSAKDMATLFAYVVDKHPGLLEATQEREITLSSNIKSHTARNTDVLADVIPGLKASKTGFTDLAGGNLVIVFDPEIGRPIAVSVLGSTEEGRFEDMRLLVSKALEKLSTDSVGGSK